ncbi:MAG: CxxC-x17-CxxC domain-containing protein [bacterium]
MNNDITIFAETNFRNQKRRFGIKRDDRRRHMYLIGKTGMGKSTMLENMIVDDIRSGKGVAVVDPHGDLVEKIINYIPSRRINDVINFDPSDMDYPIAFNPLESIDPRYKHLICSGLISVFKKLWADSWGPRLEYLLRNAILALLDTSGTTLLGIMRLLVDKGYRKKIITNIKDPVVKAFWVDEYSKYPDKFQVEAISPIQNKVGQFLSNFLIRNIVGQVKSSFDMREVMDKEKILLVNLSKGRIGEDTSSLLGSMMITKIQLAAMDRINIKEEDRKDFYLYVDEFQNFATDSFATILSEARKYHLNLIMAHQYIEQLNEVVRPAVFGNVGTMVLFRIGAADAEELVKEFTPKFTEENLVNIPKWECYMKLMVDGIATDPFSANGLPPLKADEMTNNTEKVLNLSRERYAERRAIIEEKIARWSGVDMQENNPLSLQGKIKNEGNETQELKIIPDYRSDDNARKSPAFPKEKNLDTNNDKNISYGYEAVCSACGKETRVNFKPDNVRSVFCRECLKKFKKGEIDVHKINETMNSKIRREENGRQEIRIPTADYSADRQARKSIDEHKITESKNQQNLPRSQNEINGKEELKINNYDTWNFVSASLSPQHKADVAEKLAGEEKKKDKDGARVLGIATENKKWNSYNNRKLDESDDACNEKNEDKTVSLFNAFKKGAVDFKGRQIVNSSIDVDKKNIDEKEAESLSAKFDGESEEETVITSENVAEKNKKLEISNSNLHAYRKIDNKDAKDGEKYGAAENNYNARQSSEKPIKRKILNRGQVVRINN